MVVFGKARYSAELTEADLKIKVNATDFYQAFLRHSAFGVMEEEEEQHKHTPECNPQLISRPLLFREQTEKLLTTYRIKPYFDF